MILLELLENRVNRNEIGEAVEMLAAPGDIVENERVIPFRNEGYYEEVIPNYTSDDFQSHFRMARGTFQSLLNVLQMRRGEIDGEKVDFEKKVLFTIWMLSKPGSFIAAGDRFDLAKSTSHEVFISIVNLLVSVRMEYIQWPDYDERQRISRTLKAKSGIPRIAGAIDGCHIAIKAPPRNANDYYNRNNYHSVILKAVCNDNKPFTDVFVGVPGRVHDARVFRNRLSSSSSFSSGSTTNSSSSSN
uniref:Nuclease HARBI1 n=1 Tax=Diabrotica virgifera virgifera TaxID=50390 RepID=A0A6P7GUG0_DIAVI